MDRGIELYLKLNADQVKPYKSRSSSAIPKRRTAPPPRSTVQELLTQDKVDALAGWVYSPDAIASAPVVTAGKKLAVIMNAGTSFITNLSTDYVRTSFTMWHSSYAMGEQAAKTLHAKTAVVAYSDYPPGRDSLEAFKNCFRSQRRQGDRRHSGGRPRRGAGFHAILPARQGREAGCSVRVRAGRRSRVGGGQDLRRARHGTPPASS